MYKWIVFIVNISRNSQTISQIILPTPNFKIDIVGKWHHSIFLAENNLIWDTVFSMCLGLQITCIDGPTPILLHRKNNCDVQLAKQDTNKKYIVNYYIFDKL